jgi:DNA-binding SARP family transcriptional activator
MINVAMLGRMSVTIDRKRVPLNLGDRGRLLAGYLFEFPGRVFRREQLSDLFWEDRDAEHARGALNTALWRIRKILASDAGSRPADCIHSSGDEIVFEPSASVLIDTHQFAGVARQAFQPGSPCGRDVRCTLLDQAVSHYSGEFLDGDDGDWIIAERERLHSLYVRCLCELMRTHAARDDFEAAIAAGRRVLGADPFRETVMRMLAILLFLNGQRAQAITELTRWQSALRAQVGVTALPETRELHASLVSGSICQDLAHWRQSHLAPLPLTS